MPGRRIVVHFVWIIVVIAATCVGYVARGFVGRWEKRARPIVETDVSSEWLHRVGLPFGRPTGASNVAVAIVGNGVGDSMVYVSFDLPEGQSQNFLDDLKSSQGFEPFVPSGKVHYLETLDPDDAALLWPRSGFDDAEAIRSGNVTVAHQPGSVRIHANVL